MFFEVVGEVFYSFVEVSWVLSLSVFHLVGDVEGADQVVVSSGGDASSSVGLHIYESTCLT